MECLAVMLSFPLKPTFDLKGEVVDCLCWSDGSPDRSL